MGFMQNLKVGAAKESNNRDTNPPIGVHTLALVECAEFETRNHGKNAARVSFVAVSSTNPAVVPGTPYGEAFFVQHPNGDNAAHALGRLRKVVRALGDLEASATEAEIDQAVGELWNGDGSAARGVVVRCTATETPKQQDGKQYIRTAYAAITQTDQEIAEMRARIDDNNFADLIKVAAPAAAPAAAPSAPAAVSRSIMGRMTRPQ
jgi:hypothetical protein